MMKLGFDTQGAVALPEESGRGRDHLFAWATNLRH
jgi:hypothetical protein